MVRIAALYRYPVKGLSAEPLGKVSLEPGATFPFDRAFAVENGPSGFDSADPRYLPKAHFLMLMRNEGLAALATRYDDATGILTIDDRDGNRLAEGCLDTPGGCAAIERFFNFYAAADLRGPARLLRAPGHSFSDVAMKCISLINLETVRAIERHVGAPVDPLRFRGNLYVDDLPAFAEFDWIGGRIAAGSLALKAVKRITRCAATNVNPSTARRDMAIPRAILEAFGHDECGIYLKVEAGGETAVGDAIGPAG